MYTERASSRLPSASTFRLKACGKAPSWSALGRGGASRGGSYPISCSASRSSEAGTPGLTAVNRKPDPSGPGGAEV